ncbi:MAG: HNH endonuclease [Pseudomonadota bacterium]|uniref:HNH endonuclease n=1 Tax=Sphingobium naphthae TaxID=1886786 RepID=UPI002B0DD176|nr:HNH endonuclease [Pseudomonadota bacterium]
MKKCLSEPIPAIFVAARLLHQAGEAHQAGDRQEASRLLMAADDPAVREHTEMLWGAGGRQRFKFITLPDAPPYFAKLDRPLPRMPTKTICARIIARDGYHCRFCGIPVIGADTRKAIRKAYPDAVPWGKTNILQHAALQCMWLQYDHILPNARGGGSDIDNVVVTCAPCNFGRMEHTLEEAQLNDPRLDFRRDTWNGYRSWNGLAQFGAIG